MMGNKVAADFHKQITLLNFNKFQFNEIKNALNRFSTNSLHREMTSWQKNCKPSLGSGVTTVWRRRQSSNKSADLNTVSGRSRHQTTHQALTFSVTAQQRKNNVPKTVLWHHRAEFEQANAALTKHQLEYNGRRNETSDNQSVIYLVKDTTTTWEKRCKDCFPDVMELTMSRKTPAEQQTTYCFVNLVGCVQW